MATSPPSSSTRDGREDPTSPTPSSSSITSSSSSSSTSPGNSIKARPTQSYYVPRHVLDSSKRPSEDNSQRISPDRTGSNSGRMVGPSKSKGQTQQLYKPRPLMETMLTRDENYNNQNDYRGNRQSPKREVRTEKPQNTLNRRQKKEERKEPVKDEMFPKVLMVPMPQRPAVSLFATAPPKTGSQKSASPPSTPTSIAAPIVTPSPTAASTSTPPAEDTACICERPDTHIACKRCGFECMGRLVLVCPQHPLAMCLMDLAHCPNARCHSVQLFEIAI